MKKILVISIMLTVIITLDPILGSKVMKKLIFGLVGLGELLTRPTRRK